MEWLDEIVHPFHPDCKAGFFLFHFGHIFSFTLEFLKPVLIPTSCLDSLPGGKVDMILPFLVVAPRPPSRGLADCKTRRCFQI